MHSYCLTAVIYKRSFRRRCRLGTVQVSRARVPCSRECTYLRVNPESSHHNYYARSRLAFSFCAPQPTPLRGRRNRTAQALDFGCHLGRERTEGPGRGAQSSGGILVSALEPESCTGLPISKRARAPCFLMRAFHASLPTP